MTHYLPILTADEYGYFNPILDDGPPDDYHIYLEWREEETLARRAAGEMVAEVPISRADFEKYLRYRHKAKSNEALQEFLDEWRGQPRWAEFEETEITISLEPELLRA